MLITISGPSTIGKDSRWLRLANTLGFEIEVPFTTRPIRASEIDGVSHRFVSTLQFHEMIRQGQLTEWDFTLGNYYGTALALRSKVESGQNVVLQVLGRMALRLRARVPNVVTVMLQASDRAVLDTRLAGRGYRADEIEQRIAHADEEAVHASLFDYLVPDADILPEDHVLRILADIVALRG